MSTQAPFGRLITAMVTPFAKDGSIDWDGVATLATHLADHGHDAIAVNGTTVDISIQGGGGGGGGVTSLDITSSLFI